MALGLGRRKTGKDLSIIIVGCGKVGKTLVERLEREGHDVTIIDKNPEKITRIMNNYDVMGIVGNGADYNVLMEAGVDQADVLIAVTGSDELNLLCCVVGDRFGNCDVIARVRTPDYSDETNYLKEKLELAMIINPERETAASISRILYMPTALEVESFAGGTAELVRLKLPSGNILEGKRIAELSRELTGAVLICAVERGGEIYIPGGNFRFEKGDVISFISPMKESKKFLNRLGFQTRQVKDCIVVGGGRTSFYLGRMLDEMGISVKIVERNLERCEELSTLLPNAVIINGNESDEDLLKEIGIEHTDSFVALTGIDEENILLTLYAQSVSEAKVITKINRITFHEVIDSLDLGSVIFQKYNTTEKIVAFIRAKKASMNSNIETMHHLFDDRVEAIEFKIEHESRVTNKTLTDLQIKDHVLITCINRDGKILIPGGSDELRVGDSVIIVTTHLGFSDIQDILK